MFDFFFKRLVKDWENIKEPKVRESYGKLAGIVGIISNLILSGAKVAMGLITGSIAILADGLNNLGDGASSIITLVGFRLAARPEDEDHPYGHARIEYITSLIIAGIIILVGAGLLKEALVKIFNPQDLNMSWIAIGVLLVGIIIKLWQWAFNRAAARKIDSLVLLATATDSRNDVIASSAVLISVLLGMYGNWNIDGYIGALVALFIVWSGIDLVRRSSSPLLGEAPDPELVKEIVKIVKSFSGVKGYHDLIVHNYGPGRIFASLHIEVDAKVDVMESHDLIDEIELALKEKLKIEIVVHMDPIKTDDPLITSIEKNIEESLEGLEGIYGIHGLRITREKSRKDISFHCELGSECVLSEEEIREKLEKVLKKMDPSYYPVMTFDQHYTQLEEEV